MKIAFRIYSCLAFVEGLAALVALLRVPSEAGGLWGYSAARLAVALLVLAGLLLAGFLLVQSLRWPAWLERFWLRLDGFLRPEGRLFWISFALVFTILLCVLLYLFTYLVYPPHLRGAILWAGLAALQALALLGYRYWEDYRRPAFWQPLRVLPRWANLDREQRRTFWLLALVGLLYFAAFIVPNAVDAHSQYELFRKSGDENITYPYVMWMLSPADSPAKAIYHWFIYEDYHYGYPFYFFSALAILPVRIVLGAGFAEHVQLNLLVMREMISVLPMVLAALLLTYLQTRLRSRLASLGVFVLLLFIPQVVSYNVRFWHPDALVVLMVALTLLFLDKDEYCYGLNFALAAVTSGLAAGIKLWGFFFFLAVGGYLLAGLVRRSLDLRQVVSRGALFLAVMAATIVLANPFMLVPQARSRMLAIMTEINQNVNVNMPGADQPGAAELYERGLGPSLAFLQPKYGSPWFLAFLVASLLAVGIWGPRQKTAWLIAGWILPIAAYFIFFVPYKSYHYWLPAMLPLYSAGAGLVQVITRPGQAFSRSRYYPLAASALIALVVLVLVLQFTTNLLASTPDWLQWLRWRELWL